MTTTAADRRIVIEPVTRVEGHGKVSILLDEDNKVKQARLHIVEFRGFERFIQGRLLWEVPVLVQRLCGICPVSHHLAAAKAIDRIVGADQLTPTAHKMRLLMHHGQFLQSHALHFFHLCSPDLLFGFDADVGIRHVIGVAEAHRDLAVQGVMMRKYGQEIIKATAGKKIHGTGAIPGGINKNLSIEERDGFLKDIDQMLQWARGVVDIAKNYTVDNLDTVAGFGTFESNYLSLAAEDGSYEIYDGGLRARTAEGDTIFDHVDNQVYDQHLQEEVRSWTYMKFPFIRSIGPEMGWYRVGPLARVNNADRFTTPEAEQARQEFAALTEGKPCHVTLGYHWARMIELLHSVECIQQLLNDPDLQGTDLVVKGERRHEAVGIIEAPRGTLFHHYKIDEQDQVTMANLIVSTTSNNEPMNRSVQKVAEDHLSGKTEITEGMLNHIEVAIRAYDPCLSCATHAMGQMPLVVELYDDDGTLIDTRAKG
ncbi:MAG: Ni/Fe hydrogenase subunit alpha [Gemmatimonadetes bacterium]|nr:Ni/Fe hydrogenase subunit alpha [Gemmatimonadota bacterium]MBT5055412.1 Ni/Fe hydrogenase subunit alpha [Gemmatimonadota bacterium]MBT5143468.1 Ni/Fe hydrogenase subunit alpha [Gemmatimonadota bacterium]MBT5589376.1 Ni/Fe hydrogenase subunit alpha [Gemmatimonadota bacterium]MBT5963809.1 Ni/Fe hydrogenase subunit alpha [Gemmatimonadota bacterium]